MAYIRHWQFPHGATRGDPFLSRQDKVLNNNTRAISTFYRAAAAVYIIYNTVFYNIFYLYIHTEQLVYGYTLFVYNIFPSWCFLFYFHFRSPYIAYTRLRRIFAEVKIKHSRFFKLIIIFYYTPCLSIYSLRRSAL